VRRLAAERVPHKIGIADVAREAGVSWPTARGYVGDRTQLRARLAAERPESTPVVVDTCERILAAAASVFARQGYTGATLDDVAEAAGLTKGAVYWHFSSKGDLFMALLEKQSRQQSAALPAMVAGITSAEGLAAVLAEMFAASRAEDRWPALLLEFAASRREPAVRARLAEQYRAAHAVGRGAARGTERGAPLA
jgi:AcrR family transcriptional regulator